VSARTELTRLENLLIVAAILHPRRNDISYWHGGSLIEQRGKDSTGLTVTTKTAELIN
jgi:hypothetical protein